MKKPLKIPFMLPVSVNMGSLLLRWKKKEYDFKNVKGISNKGSSVCSGSTFEVGVAFVFFYFEWMAQILVKNQKVIRTEFILQFLTYVFRKVIYCICTGHIFSCYKHTVRLLKVCHLHLLWRCFIETSDVFEILLFLRINVIGIFLWSLGSKSCSSFIVETLE